MVLLGFVGVFGAVMVAEYAFFHRALTALDDLGLAGAALTLYLLESVLVLIFTAALISFVASGLTIYYRSRDTRLLLAAPLPLGDLYVLRSLETFGVTSWALGIVGLPALLALGAAYGRRPAFYFAGAAILGAFAALTLGVGALLTAATGALFRRAPSRLGAAVVVAALLLAFLALIGRNVVPSTSDFYAVFDPGMLNGKPASVKFIEGKFAFWPSHPFAAALYTTATGRLAGSTASGLLLWLGPIAALGAAATVGRRLYARTLPLIAESFVLAGSSGRTTRPVAAFPRRLRGPIGAVVERDLLALARSPEELGRAGFIAFLLLLYTSFIIVAPLKEVADRPEAVARLLLFTVLAAGYFITAFALRFVFPSMSLEGRGAWVLFSSPTNLFRLVLARAVLYVALLSLAAVPIALIGVARLARDPGLGAAMALLLLLIAATTATVLLAAGAAWPDFKEQSPEALTGTGAGVAGTVICLVYVAGVGWVARQTALGWAAGESVVGWLLGTTLGSVALITTALVLAHHRTRTLEAP